MPILQIIPSEGLVLQRKRLEAARSMIVAGIPRILQALGTDCAQALSSAAPRGATEGAPPAGDASGPLASSFVSEVEMTGEGSGSVRVRTTQPTKLRYVREGTGIYGPKGEPIRPVLRRALYWQTAPHPYKSVRGMRPNDFVRPVTEQYVQVGDERCASLAQKIADVLTSGSGG